MTCDELIQLLRLLSAFAAPIFIVIAAVLLMDAWRIKR